MKILFLVSSIGSGGAERVAVSLCSAWAARGDQVTLMPTFSGRGDCFYTLPSELRLIYLADLVVDRKSYLINQYTRLKELRKFFFEERPDVIVSFLTNVNIAAIVASAGLKIPVVVSERTDPFIHPVSLFYRVARFLTYPFADAMVVQTQAVASKYKKKKIRLRYLCIIPNPVAQSILETQLLARNSKNKRLLAIGRFDESKQFSILINCFAALVNQFPNWSLRIVGDGPMRSTLHQQIVYLGLSERVELPGRTTEISDELAKADAFAMTSRFEGFPNALIEAMAVGLPSVAFDCPSGPREISLDGAMALLVPLNDEHAMFRALQLLMNDEELRRSLGSRARDSIFERFTLSKVLKQWDLLFDIVRKF